MTNIILKAFSSPNVQLHQFRSPSCLLGKQVLSGLFARNGNATSAHEHLRIECKHFSSDEISKFSELEAKIKALDRKYTINPFMLYKQENIKQLIEKNPNLSWREVLKRIGVEWHSLSLIQKSNYHDNAESLKKEKLKIKQELLSTLTAEELKCYKKELAEKNKMKAKKRKSKREKNVMLWMQRPKRPLNAYMIFFTSALRQQQEQQDPLEASKTMAKKWKSLDEQEKQSYLKQAAELMVKYKKDVAEWEARMLACGREDVIRKTQRRRKGPKKADSADKSSPVDAELAEKSQQLKRILTRMKKLQIAIKRAEARRNKRLMDGKSKAEPKSSSIISFESNI